MADNMKTVCLLGSPRRNGNSDTLAMRFVKQAQQFKAPVETFALSQLSFNGCINLFRCKQDLLHCGQTDELTPVLQSIFDSQVLVLASPVYFTSISGQLKLAIDRFFSFFVPDYPSVAKKSRLSSGRHLVFLQTQGEGQDRYADLMQSFSAGFTNLGFDHQYHVRATGVRQPGDAKKLTSVLNECDRVASTIYGRR